VIRVGVVAGLVVVGAWARAASAQVVAPAPEVISIGDWQLAPVVEARVRGEYRYDLDGENRGFLVERARLGVDVQRGPVEGRVVLDDVRVWGLAAGQPQGWEPAAQPLTGAYEAWAEAHSSSARPAFLRVGRQPVQWGEGRLLGVSDWSPRGRTLDAVRGRLPLGDGAFELLAAVVSDPVALPLAAGTELFGARGEWVYHPLFAVEGYVLARLSQLPSSYQSVHGQTYTGALRLHGDASAWTWGIEGAYQLGRAEDVRGGEDRAAWAAAAHVAHTFERLMLLPTVLVGGSYASGDDGSSTYHAFDQILPDVHVWHGAMDLFGWSNEAEVSARAAIAPWTDAVASIEYRYARLAQPGGAWRSDYLVQIGTDPTNTQPDLGHEVDAVLTWSPWVAIELVAGYSFLVLGEGARAVLRAPPPLSQGAVPPNVAQLAYLQGTLRLP
jgi:hypothetical protein